MKGTCRPARGRVGVLAFAVLLAAVSAWVLQVPPAARAGADRGPLPATEKKEDVMADKEQLTREEGEQLLSLARKTIEARMRGEPPPSEEVPEKLRRKGGTFVTLTMDGCLRGCIGHIVAREPIFEGVKENAVNAAFCDPRFRPLTPEEWEKVHVEVSVLSDPQPLPYEGPEDLLEKLRVGVDGLIVRKGPRQSTFLPQVWEQLPGKEEFLTHLCLKAGLPGDAWRREPLEVFTYQVQAFEE